MKNIVFIAPPAAGKGTQSDFIKDKYHMVHISTGDLLREVAGNGTDFGNQITELISNGILIEDELMARMIQSKIESLGNTNGIILDGFPRNIKQADMLDSMMKSLNQKIDYVIYLDISREEAMKRTLGRVSCPSCGAVYNEYGDIFKAMGFCNKCSTKLEKRTDDNEETFNHRFDTYLEKTKPVIDYYKLKGILYIVDSGVNKDYTFSQIQKIISGAKND